MTILVLRILRLLILGLTVLRGLRILLISGIRVGLRLRILRLLVSLLLCLTVLGLLILLSVLAGVRVLLRIVVLVGHLGSLSILEGCYFYIKVFSVGIG